MKFQCNIVPRDALDIQERAVPGAQIVSRAASGDLVEIMLSPDDCRDAGAELLRIGGAPPFVPKSCGYVEPPERREPTPDDHETAIGILMHGTQELLRVLHIAKELAKARQEGERIGLMRAAKRLHDAGETLAAGDLAKLADVL